MNRIINSTLNYIIVNVHGIIRNTLHYIDIWIGLEESYTRNSIMYILNKIDDLIEYTGYRN